jgi:hypothetical protein
MGEPAQLSFALKISGDFFFDLGEISPIQQILRLSNGRNSPKLGKIHPKLERKKITVLNTSDGSFGYYSGVQKQGKILKN